MKEDKFSQHFSLFTCSESIKTVFEEFKSRNQVYKKTSTMGEPFIEILNIDGLITINEKICALADYIPEKSKIFLHFLIANNAEITKDLAESSEKRNEYL